MLFWILSNVYSGHNFKQNFKYLHCFKNYSRNNFYFRNDTNALSVEMSFHEKNILNYSRRSNDYFLICRG